MWIVQNDKQTVTTSGEPGDEWTYPAPGAIGPPKVMVGALHASDQWQKVSCVRVFNRLGLPTADLRVLEDPHVLSALAGGHAGPDTLLEELEELMLAPVVVRTDRLSDKLSQEGILLPRTETCTDAADVLLFMRQTSKYFLEAGLQPDQFCFLIHRFIPARAGSYSIARPGTTRVRVDSTWGMPDGLLFLPHDSFEVDTKDPESIWSALRCKYAYIDVKAGGTWYERTAGSPKDWVESLNRDQLQTIASQSLAIAEAIDSPVEVMHFVSVRAGWGMPDCLPWFFRETDASVRQTESAPRFSNRRRVIRTPADLDQLGDDLRRSRDTVSSILLSAACSHLRDRAFVDQVGTIAKQFAVPVDLEGSVLAHVFYLLRSNGVRVRTFDQRDPPSPQARIYRKLVRDHIPRKIELGGERAITERAEGDLLIRWLRQKVVEESLELFSAADAEDILVEAADTLEAVLSLCHQYGISIDAVLKAADEKREERGGFTKGVILESTFSTPTLIPARTDKLFAVPRLDDDPEATALMSLRQRPYQPVSLSRVPSLSASEHSVYSVAFDARIGGLSVRNDGERIQLELLRPRASEMDGQLVLFDERD